MNPTDTIAENQALFETPVTGRAIRSTRRAAWLLRPAVVAALYAVAVLIASIALHPILAWTAELDNYIGQARRLSQGELPNDGFHPLGYSVFIRLLAPIVGDYLLAARVISAASAGVLVWATHCLVRKPFGPVAAWTAMALVALHPIVVDNGMQVTSDSLAAAAIMVTLVLAARTVREASPWRVLWLGIGFAMAYWARYPAMSLLVVVIPVLWMCETRQLRERIQRYAVFAVGAILGLVPHCALTYAQFGQLFHDESWRNLAMAHFARVDGGFDYQTLYTDRFHSWLSVIAYDPMTIVRQGADSIARSFVYDLPMMLTGDATWPAGWVEWLVYAAVPVGWVAALVLGRPILLLAGVFTVVYLSVVSVVLHMYDRFTLPCLPLLLGSATSLIWLTGAALRRVPRVAMAIQTAAAAALVAYVASGLPARIDALQRAEPHEEMQAIRDIVKEHGSTVVIGTIMCQLAEQVPFVPRWLPRDYGTPTDRHEFYATDYVLRCVEMAATAEMDYIVIGAVTFGAEQTDGHARIKALENAPLPPDFERVRQDDEVLVWRVRKPFTSKDWRPESAGWRPLIRLTPNPVTKPEDELRIEIDCGPVMTELSSIDLLAKDPAGAYHEFSDLPRVAPGVSQTVGSAELLSGDWRLRARAKLSTGLVYGSEAVLTVR